MLEIKVILASWDLSFREKEMEDTDREGVFVAGALFLSLYNCKRGKEIKLVHQI